MLLSFQQGGIPNEMPLLGLLLILILPYLALTIANRVLPGFMTARAARLRAGLFLLLCVTGTAHFTRTGLMVEMIPAALPFRETLIYAAGLAQFAAALLICWPATRPTAGLLLIIMFVCFVPINVYAALKSTDFGIQIQGPSYLFFRLPFQFLLVWWTYYATGQRWLHRRQQPPPP